MWRGRGTWRGGGGGGGLLTNREFDKLYSLYCPLPFHHFVLKVFECEGRGGEGGVAYQ